jgi:SNF2 family DNA or RNA helicase
MNQFAVVDAADVDDDSDYSSHLSVDDMELSAAIEASLDRARGTGQEAPERDSIAVTSTKSFVGGHVRQSRKEASVKSEDVELDRVHPEVKRIKCEVEFKQESSRTPLQPPRPQTSLTGVKPEVKAEIKPEIKPEVKPEGGNGRGGGVADIPEDFSAPLHPPQPQRPIPAALQQIIQDIQSDDVVVLARLGFKTVLKPHQKEAVVFALHRANCDLGTAVLDSMGLGKTVETLAILCCIRAWQQSRLPFLVCVPKGLIDQWTEEIVTHTTLAQFGDGITPYVDMDRHGLYPNYDSIATSSVILTTRHTILSDMKQVYTKMEETGFSSALFPDLSEYDAACVLVCGQGKLRKQIAEQYPEIAFENANRFYRSFQDSIWSRSSASWTRRFAALVVDEAHQLRNQSTPTTRAVYALSKSTSFRYLLTGTPFNNCVWDVATLAWLLQDRGAWEDLGWWRSMDGQARDGRARLESESVQANLRAWRASVLIRGKDRIMRELPSRTEVIVPVEATDAEKKYSATLFIKFQAAIMEHDRAARHERNRFLAWSHILTTLLRMMQMTTHRLITTKNSRDFTHHYSRLSNYKYKPSCVNCELFPDDVPLVQGARAHREVQAEDWLANNGDSDIDDGSDEHALHSGRAAAVRRISPLPCGHDVCAACMQLFQADPLTSPCQFCKDMLEIGMEMHHHYSSLPPPSSKLNVLVRELRMLSQHCVSAPKQEACKQETLTQVTPKQETSKQEAAKQKTVEKAVVFTLFKATLDICEALLRDAGISHVRIDGDMTMPDRTSAVASFMHDESVHVLLASSHAAGLGLNLCRATTVIFLDRW